MATQYKNTNSLDTTFITQNGMEKEISIPRPKDDLTDTEYYNAMCKIIASNAMKPDRTPLKTISQMVMVEKEETILDVKSILGGE